MKNLLEKIIYKSSTQFFCLLSIDYNIAKREVMIQVAPEGELKNNNRFKFIDVENYNVVNTDDDEDNDFFQRVL